MGANCPARPRAANCPGCNPPRTCANLLMSTSEASCHGRDLTAEALRRGRALVVRTGASVACRPRARIESPSTGPRTCADGPMSTSEASVSPAGSVGPGPHWGPGPKGANCPARPRAANCPGRNPRELPGAQPPAPVTYLVLSCKKEKKGGKPRCSRKAFPGDGW